MAGKKELTDEQLIKMTPEQVLAKSEGSIVERYMAARFANAGVDVARELTLKTLNRTNIVDRIQMGIGLVDRSFKARVNQHCYDNQLIQQEFIVDAVESYLDAHEQKTTKKSRKKK